VTSARFLFNDFEESAMSLTGTDSQKTRGSLLDRLRLRDARAWQELVELYATLVWQWCAHRRLDEHASADVVQDVFAAVSTSLPTFQPCGLENSFRRWLWTITRNKMMDHFRRQSHEPVAVGGSSARQRLELVPSDEPTDSDEPTTEQNVRGLLQRALRQVEAEFEPRTWQAFWRSTVDAISTDVVARELGILPATVRQARSRVLRRLRCQLGEVQ
jgi:RNA polymerase sigma-70 factor, ECF subfamily